MTPDVFDLGDVGMLHCPCGSDFVHLERIEIDRDGNVLTVDNKLDARLGKRKPTARGAFADFYCWCEGGHRFVLRFVFHKGQIALDIRDWKEREFDDSPSDLWRN